jgi:hypothetical protein
MSFAYGISMPKNYIVPNSTRLVVDTTKESSQIKILKRKYLKEKKLRQLVEKNAELRRKNMWLGIGLILIFFCIIISYLFYIQYTLKIRQRLQESGLEYAINELREQNKGLQQKLQEAEESNNHKS